MEVWENDPENSNPNLYTYLNRITLLSRDDGDDENDKGKVNLMTIHASKGLEFPVVFIAGAEEGLIPHARSVAENEGKKKEDYSMLLLHELEISCLFQPAENASICR